MLAMFYVFVGVWVHPAIMFSGVCYFGLCGCGHGYGWGMLKSLANYFVVRFPFPVSVPLWFGGSRLSLPVYVSLHQS